jgi:hypothetical protein
MLRPVLAVADLMQYSADTVKRWKLNHTERGRPPALRGTSLPGTMHGGWIEKSDLVGHPAQAFIRTPAGVLIPAFAGGSRQYFQDTLADPPIANLTAVTATAETILWNVTNYTPIAAGDCRYGKIYRVYAGGIMSFAATGTLIITPRFGLTVAAGITMGASVVALTTPGATTANAWSMQFTAIGRTVGAPGANSTVIGTGFFITGIPSAGSLPGSQVFGGTSATADVSIATGICMGWTLSVAGTVTPQYAFIQSLT